ncbi:hypothetical protein [Nocardia salmonicida]|uniref:hypothetical protein n=1 Tax=Nocardia salmonicida TaxID=53431 RepID=UPI0037B33E7A
MPKFYPDEIREKAVRSIVDRPSEWAAIKTVAGRIGANPKPSRNQVRKTQDATANPAAPEPVPEDMAAELPSCGKNTKADGLQPRCQSSATNANQIWSGVSSAVRATSSRTRTV